MSKEDREEMLSLALNDYIMMIENSFPLENARFIIFRDYDLLREEQSLLMEQFLKILEDKVGTL